MKKKHFISVIALAVLLSIAMIALTSCGFLHKKELHGEELLELSDDELYETVYLQTLDVIESYPDEETALSEVSAEQRLFFILSIYDMEIQCGGLCSFFVNTSRTLAPYVEESLDTVGAAEHKELFAEFITENNINVNDLDSFIVDDVNDYESQTKRYDFKSFDEKYVEMSMLQDYLTEYIKANIEKF